MKACFFLFMGVATSIVLLVVVQRGCSKQPEQTNPPPQAESQEKWYEKIPMPIRYGQKTPFPDSIELPEIRAALEAQEKTEDCRFRLASLSSKMDESVSKTVDSISLEVADGHASSRSEELKELAEAAATLKAMAHEILNNKDEYLQAIVEYEEAAEEATDKLRHAAKLFGGFAEKETYEDFQDDYRTIAEVLESLAKHYETQLAGFHTNLSKPDFMAIIAYLERGALMLDRFEAALAIATPLSELAESSRYLQKLREFIQKFESFRTRIRQVNEGLKESDPPSSSTAKNVPNREDNPYLFQIAKTEFAIRELFA